MPRSGARIDQSPGGRIPSVSGHSHRLTSSGIEAGTAAADVTRAPAHSANVGLENEGIDAAVDQDRRLFDRGAGAIAGRRSDVADHKPAGSRGQASQSDGAAIDRLDIAFAPKSPQPERLAPNVLVKIAPAPAATSRRWISQDIRRAGQVPECGIVRPRIEPERHEPRTHAGIQNQGPIFRISSNRVDTDVIAVGHRLVAGVMVDHLGCVDRRWFNHVLVRLR